MSLAGDDPHRRIKPALRRLLRQLAADRGCHTDDLSERLVQAVHSTMLECYRLGAEREEITARTNLTEEQRRLLSRIDE